MIVKPVPRNSGKGRRASGVAVFGRVADYNEFDRDGLERGEVLTADCILDQRTAVAEMEAVALEVPGCKEPTLHIVASWQADEHPTIEQQREAVEKILENLTRDGRDMSGHQWIAVMHKDTDCDHLHILLNRVHPETGRQLAPEWLERSLDKAGREIEAAQGWKETPGLMKWDAELGRAVPTPKAVLEALRAERGAGAMPEAAQRMESHSYSESFTGYVQRSGVGKELREVLNSESATWADVQRTFGRHGLELQQGERGGYTIRDETGRHIAKASDVREVFSGAANKARLEQLGNWSGPDRSEQRQTYDQNREPPTPEKVEEKAQLEKAQEQQPQQVEKAAPYRRNDPAAQAERDRRAAERAQARQALYERYQDYRKNHAAKNPPQSREQIKDQYKQIRDEHWQEKRAVWQRTKRGSGARLAGESVAAFHAMEKRDQLRADLAAQRQQIRPTAWKDWVADRANDGDKAAQAQMRGWEYQKSRVPEADRARLEQADRQQPAKNEGLTADVEWRRRWIMGGVEYKIDGKAAVIDKGGRITLVEGKKGADDRAVALALGLSAARDKGVAGVTGNREFKERCVNVAAERQMDIRFRDPNMQAAFEQLKKRNQAERNQVRPAQPQKGQEQAKGQATGSKQPWRMDPADGQRRAEQAQHQQEKEQGRGR